MILTPSGQAPNQTMGGRVTLDGLLRRAAELHGDAPALLDAQNRPMTIGGPARQLSFADVDRTVNALARRLLAAGLATDTVIATQFALSSDAVIALLAISRAGMIAAPVPLGWGRRETSSYLQRIGARAILCASRSGSIDSADIMREAAAETFSVRFVFSLGEPVLDGVVALDEVFADEDASEKIETARVGNPADHVALVTAETTADGFVALARSANQVIAGGLTSFIAGTPDAKSVMAATLSPDTFAGIATQIVPWLMSQSKLILHPPLAPRVMREALVADKVTHAVLPVSLAGLAVNLNGAALSHILLIGRRHTDVAAAAKLVVPGAIVDFFFAPGEIGLVGIRRTSESAVLANGPQSFSKAASNAPILVETRINANGSLELRGAMVPGSAFPPGSERMSQATLAFDKEGFVDTGFAAHAAAEGLAVDADPVGVIAVGGRRFAESDIRAAYVEAGGEIAPVIKADPILGQRVAGLIGDGRGIAGLGVRLSDMGLTPLAVPGAGRHAGPLPFEDTSPRPKPVLEPEDDRRAALDAFLAMAKAAASR